MILSLSHSSCLYLVCIHTHTYQCAILLWLHRSAVKIPFLVHSGRHFVAMSRRSKKEGSSLDRGAPRGKHQRCALPVKNLVNWHVLLDVKMMRFPASHNNLWKFTVVWVKILFGPGNHRWMKITPFSDHRIVGDTMTSLIWHNVVNSIVIGNETFERGESPEIQEKLLLHHASLSFPEKQEVECLDAYTPVYVHSQKSTLKGPTWKCVRVSVSTC